MLVSVMKPDFRDEGGAWPLTALAYARALL